MREKYWLSVPGDDVVFGLVFDSNKNLVTLKASAATKDFLLDFCAEAGLSVGDKRGAYALGDLHGWRWSRGVQDVSTSDWETFKEKLIEFRFFLEPTRSFRRFSR